ncbi:cell division protein FtsZ [Niallia alba]|uniref:cell division protein FtsZ n=1 Tax=Niallia alba TaxID=2729105 RepID=UPI002E22129F|nr:cell division protein FtsZ [Niallia alba]
MYFGFIGLGAGGSNIADEAAKKGYDAIAINYSKSDLDSLVNIKPEHRHYLIGSEGVGKERETARTLLKNNYESVIDFVKKHLSKSSVEVIVVSFSAGGGSGSGLSTILLEILSQQMPTKVFVASPILPSKSEVLINQINTLSLLEELSQIDVCTIPIDNETVITRNGFLSKSKLFQITNSKFIQQLDELVEYTDKQSKNGILDKKDLKQLFSIKGIAVISKVKVLDISGTTLTTDHFANTIQKSWNETIYTPIETNRILRAGIIFNGTERFMEYIDYDKLFSIFGNKSPVDLFEANYTENKGEVISILSGMEWINTRISEIDELVEQQKMNLANVEVVEYKAKNTNKDDIFSRFSVKKEQKTQKSSALLSEFFK